MQLATADKPDGYAVWPENWEVLQSFTSLCCGGEVWRYAPHGGRVGLDYTQLTTLAQLLGVALSPLQLQEFRIMARAVVEVEQR